MNRDPITLALLAAILLTGIASTALLFEERLERHEAARQAREMSAKLKADTDKMLAESKAFTDKMLQNMPKLRHHEGVALHRRAPEPQVRLEVSEGSQTLRV
jgi:hypothetical protein